MLLGLETSDTGPVGKRRKCGGGALNLGHHGLGGGSEVWTRLLPRHHWQVDLPVPTSTVW